MQAKGRRGDITKEFDVQRRRRLQADVPGRRLQLKRNPEETLEVPLSIETLFMLLSAPLHAGVLT